MSRSGIARTIALVLSCLATAGGFAQAAPQAQGIELPMAKVVLFSSGVGYFEHRGSVSGEALVLLPFGSGEVNDALKSLVVWDAPAAQGSPSVSYPSQEGLDRALKGLRVDLSGSPRVAELLARLRGAEITADVPDALTGRIVSIEERTVAKELGPEPFLVLLAKDGLRAIPLSRVTAIRFSDRRVGEDFDRALALILSAQDTLRKTLELRLPGAGPRQAAVGYVVEAPVWKASYRLDLSGAKPWLQGWAIVDNTTDYDWKGVSLSLVSGRPVSFVQDLYAPLYLDRPLIPLAIAGTAAPRSFESGMEPEPLAFDKYAEEKAAPRAKSEAPSPASRAMAGAPGGAGLGGAGLAAAAVEAAQSRAAGDQFEFTIKRPVSLERRRSAMLSLVAGEIAAEKVSVLSPGAARPMLGARLSNTTGTKLPAGPITVFDGGVYAGDALLDFLPEKDNRLIVYGEDLAVSAIASSASSRETTAVTVSKGVMTFLRRTTSTRTYELRNASATPRTIVVEHPLTPGAELFEPKAYVEKTASAYRFDLALPAAGKASLSVSERSPSRELVVLSSLGVDAFLSYSSSKDIPQGIRDALKKAVELRRKSDDAKRSVSELQSRRGELASDQSRLRDNLEATGRDSPQGQQYLKRLMDAEAAIDGLDTKIAEARKASQEAQAAYDGYLAGLTLE